MERFVVSARKYRPQTFKTVVGQEHITNTLKNAFKNNQLAQAFLFCGPRGVGKTTCARILAKTINCFHQTPDQEACDACESCVSFNGGQSLNVHELDAASNNSVDNIRSLVEQVRFAPQLGSFKVYIIDEVHMLSVAAFNAFLKTLEEPPKHAIFILATTEKHKIIPTILSRCQIFDFQRIKVSDITSHLAWIAKTEGIEAEPDALRVIAQKADGGLRDACSMFDVMVSFGAGTLKYKSVLENLHILDYDYYFRITRHIMEGKSADVLLVFDEVLRKGFDGHHFIAGLGEHFRNLMMCKDPLTIVLLEVGPQIAKEYSAQSESCAGRFLLHALQICNRCDASYKSARNQRLHVELTLLQMAEFAVPSEAPEKKNDLNERAAQVIPPAEEKHTVEKKAQETKAQPDFSQIIKNPESAGIPSSGFRLKGAKDILDGTSSRKSEPTETEIIKVPFNEAISEDLLRMSAQNFAANLMEQGKRQIANMLRPTSLKLQNETEVLIEIENAAQRESFEPHRQNFAEYLRKILNNSLITIVMKEKSEEKVSKAYSPSEKFEVLNKLNPFLSVLRNSLDMDVDY